MSKKTIIYDLRVEITPPRYVARWGTIARKTKELTDWAKDLQAFVRDHRSQDDIELNVVSDCKDICSHCEFDWETDETGLPLCCAAAQSEFETQRESA